MAGGEYCQDHSGCIKEIDGLSKWKDVHEQKEHSDIWAQINALKNLVNTRLPIWATFLIAGQTGVIGWLLAALKG